MDSNTVEQGKTTAIISYITFIGLIVAFIMNNDKKNAFASFHIRQMTGLTLFSLINSFLIARIGSIGAMVSMVISIALIVLWIIAFIGVMKGETKKIPVLGDSFQDWFKGIG